MYMDPYIGFSWTEVLWQSQLKKSKVRCLVTAFADHRGGLVDYRILSLDGDGTWTLIQVKALIQLYGAETTGHGVLRDFDLVVASFGGNIVLGALRRKLAA